MLCKAGKIGQGFSIEVILSIFVDLTQYLDDFENLIIIIKFF